MAYVYVKTHSPVISGSVYYIQNTRKFNYRFNITEEYDAELNKSRFTLTKSEIAFAVNEHANIYGRVKLNSTIVATYDGTSVTTSGSSSTYVTYGSRGGSIEVNHDESGAAPSIKLGFAKWTDGWPSDLGSNYGYTPQTGIVVGFSISKTVSISVSTHTNLAVNPNGGVWEGSSSQQTFNQVANTTKIISNPTKQGYTFKGWALTGGGTFDDSTNEYTFGSSSGTLTATWEIQSFTLSISQTMGTEVSVEKNGVPLSAGSIIQYSDVLSISINNKIGYRIGTHLVNNIEWTTGNYTVTSNVSIIATATLITYALSTNFSNVGLTASIARISSPIGNGSLTTLTNGATLYQNDVLRISYSIGGAYKVETAEINNSIDFSNVYIYDYTVTQNTSVVIIVKLGAVIYIGNEQYQCFIYDGTNWSQYQAYIGNGTSFDQY